MVGDFAETSDEESSAAATNATKSRDSKAFLWVGGVALNLWLVAVAIPGLRGSSDISVFEAFLGGLSFFGVFAAAESARRGRSVPLLVLLPLLIFVYLLAGYGAQDGFALIAMSVGMAAYVATASSFGTRPRWHRVDVRSLGSPSTGKEAARRGTLRRGVTVVVALAAFVVGVVVPAVGFDEASWDEQARPAARALVAVMSGLVATLMLAAFVGPAARRRRTRPTHEERRRRRIGMLLTVALFGALLAFAISR